MTGENSPIYCFRCADKLIVRRGERFCVRGNMGLSKKLSELVDTALAASPSAAAPPADINTNFRCVRCRGVMAQTHDTGTLTCSGCCLQYSPSMVYQMIELHPHEKILKTGEPLTRS